MTTGFDSNQPGNEPSSNKDSKRGSREDPSTQDTGGSMPPINRKDEKRALEICAKLRLGRIKEGCAALNPSQVTASGVVPALIAAFSWTDNGAKQFKDKEEAKRFTEMNEADQKLLVTSLQTIAEKNPTSVIPLLFKELRDENSGIRAGVAATLGQLKKYTGNRIAAMASMITDESSDGWKDLLKDLQLLGPAAETAIPVLIEGLEKSTSRGRTTERQTEIARTLYELGRHDPSAYLPDLIEKLSHDKAYVQTTAALALSYFGKNAVDSRDALYEMLFDRKPTCKKAALQAMAVILSPPVPEQIEERMVHLFSKDISFEVRNEALKALGRFAKKSLVMNFLLEELALLDGGGRQSQRDPVMLRKEHSRFEAIYECAAALANRDNMISNILEEGICHRQKPLAIIACRSIPIIENFSYAKRYFKLALNFYDREVEVRKTAIEGLATYGRVAEGMLEQQINFERTIEMKAFVKNVLKNLRNTQPK